MDFLILMHIIKVADNEVVYFSFPNGNLNLQLLVLNLMQFPLVCISLLDNCVTNLSIRMKLISTDWISCSVVSFHIQQQGIRERINLNPMQKVVVQVQMWRLNCSLGFLKQEQGASLLLIKTKLEIIGIPAYTNIK